MAIEGLNHYNIVAPPKLMKAVRDFYVDVVGLREGDRPDFDFPGHWLYAGDAAVLHLMDGDARGWSGNPDGKLGTGNLDHIAFTATDFEAVEAKLIAHGIAYKKSEIPRFNLMQLFLHDPIGLGVELNFAMS